MQVSQPLTYSDLGVYNKISDFGILAKSSTVWDIIGIFTETLEEMHVRLLGDFPPFTMVLGEAGVIS